MEEIVSIYPLIEYTYGNQPVFIKTGYFFDKKSPQAVCKFSYESDSDEIFSRNVQVVSSNDTHIICYHPPAYLISNELVVDGGQVSLTVSSNGIDFSEEGSDDIQVFTYRVFPEVTFMDLTFIVLDKPGQIVTL